MSNIRIICDRKGNLDYKERHRLSDEELIKLIEKQYGVKRGFLHNLFGGLFVSNKEKGGCCNIELEEVAEEKSDNENDSEETKQKNG
ncbi:hypothetical protein Amet_3864 [Alkaliphilus metalliredigens QYMF]|uniref:Uncharacterized protein n=1 Tax=Alkaliphilus metalliredigens (strain QYMF) TaxID=293826 RepID=A6TUV9_ALKMQ|nr:hypothetical protein [Alkaliphilus metalliredigens]ABR49977.1 hypothetical protein Amet_3864 [Alkaliphilus metalliredigens QYMF]